MCKRFLSLSVSSLVLAGLFAALGAGARAADTGGPAVPITSAAKALYVLVDSGDKSAATLLTVAVAAELNRHFTRREGRSPDAGTNYGDLGPSAIPQSNWTPEDLAKSCRDNPNAIGGVIVAYFNGDATHFYLLYQTATTTFQLAAQVVMCKRSPSLEAETVAVITQLHNANGTSWTVRRSDASIPLITGLLAYTLFHHNTSTSSSNITVATLAAATFSQSLSHDVPGYSQPVRMRFGAQHVGDDLSREIRWMCGLPDPTLSPGDANYKTSTPPAAGSDLAGMCSALEFMPAP